MRRWRSRMSHSSRHWQSGGGLALSILRRRGGAGGPGEQAEEARKRRSYNELRVAPQRPPPLRGLLRGSGTCIGT
eukprot:10049252-Prorocentrum_lima.AAC.1